ncbi:MAG: Eco57I restriction-modification methylase domain-containing protein [Desulfomonilaceae bacterium]
MGLYTKKDEIEQVLNRFMPLVIHELSRSGAHRDIDRLFRRSISVVVQTLLSHAELGEAPRALSGAKSGTSSLTEMARQIGPLTAAEVGEIYEFLRGFKVEVKSPTRWVMAPNVASKRNQGLFYTPKEIVSYIVEQTLDALEVREPSHYLDLRILDPAVGTGRFLAEALDQLTGRVLSAVRSGDKLLLSRVDNISKRLQVNVWNHIIGQQWHKEAAVRIHILQKCLYGVDLDPVAVTIAQAALLTRAFGQGPVIPELRPHVSIGNALAGDGTGDPRGSSKENRDRRHAAAYYGKQPADGECIRAWSEEKRVFHWPIEFPEIFVKDRCGFDAVVGNPPYEILSAKESGIEERRHEQAYMRQMFRTCKGKINTYRLMLERGLNLLGKEGVLGFVVPATLLADSTADKLRRMILDDTTVLKTVIIPEKARAFEGVTQALLILITRKGGQTRRIEPIFWKGRGQIPSRGRIEIPRDLIEQTDFRIPLIRKSEDKALLEALLRHPPLGGNTSFRPVGRVHQGEINLTVHREFITAERTGYPLVRGEHIMPLFLNHPVPGNNRLDWILPGFLERHARPQKSSQSMGSAVRASSFSRLRGTPWEQDRIAIGRVVNMDTDRRLKAACVPAGAFLGDMTNFISDLNVPINYLLGLLNSRVLNRRFKLTSTNNYLSAAEIEALPIPRISNTAVPGTASRSSREEFIRLVADPADSIPGWLERIVEVSDQASINEDAASVARMIELVIDAIQNDPSSPVSGRSQIGPLWNLLDALVLKLYGVEALVAAI